MNELRVLVTGAGALLGQGILRTLRQVKGYNLKLIACDPDYRSSGNWLADVAIKVPLAKDPGYIEVLEQIISRHKINVLFVGTDVELFIITHHKKRLEEEYQLKIVVGSRETIEIGDDKWRTYEFLKNNNFPYPETVLAVDSKGVQELIKGVGFPLIVKPRVGARSIGVYKVQNEFELGKVIDANENLIVQECVGDDGNEFTAGTVTLNGQVVSCIILKRDLRDGNTLRAYHNNDLIYNDLIKKIASKLGIEGPCNFQFRLKNNKPAIFEINSRFSGTTPLRAAFGLNEVQIMLDYFDKGKIIIPEKLKKGVVLRATSDVFVDSDQWNTFKTQEELVSPKGEFIDFNAK